MKRFLVVALLTILVRPSAFGGYPEYPSKPIDLVTTVVEIHAYHADGSLSLWSATYELDPQGGVAWGSLTALDLDGDMLPREDLFITKAVLWTLNRDVFNVFWDDPSAFGSDAYPRVVELRPETTFLLDLGDAGLVFGSGYAADPSTLILDLSQVTPPDERNSTALTLEVEATFSMAEEPAPWEIDASGTFTQIAGLADPIWLGNSLANYGFADPFTKPMPDILVRYTATITPSPDGLQVDFAGTVSVSDQASEPATEQVAFVRGDPNDDGIVDMTDAVSILDCLFSGTSCTTCAAAADVNADQIIDVSDPAALLDWLFIGGPGLPEPFPGCGVDPQEDGLGCEAYDSCGEG